MSDHQVYAAKFAAMSARIAELEQQRAQAIEANRRLEGKIVEFCSFLGVKTLAEGEGKWKEVIELLRASAWLHQCKQDVSECDCPDNRIKRFLATLPEDAGHE